MLSSIRKFIFSRYPSNLSPYIEKVLIRESYLYKKSANLLLNHFETKLLRSSLLSYPHTLVIDPTNICNLKCPLCPTWQDIEARPKGMMSINNFKKIIDEIGPYLFILNLCNWGEPLLNSELCEMIKYAKKYNIIVGFSTNLNQLDDEVAVKLIESEPDMIVISIDGASQKSYSKYRRGGDFKKVIKNIKTLNSIKNSRSEPVLIWQFLINRYNEKEIDEAEQLAEKLGIEFSPSLLRPSMGKELHLPLYKRVAEIREWLPDKKEYNKYPDEIPESAKTGKSFCHWLWTSMVINWDGSLSPCCGVYEKRWDFCNLFNEDSAHSISNLRRVWNSQPYRLAREVVKAGVKKTENLNSLMQKAENESIICKNCIQYGFLDD